MNLWRLIFSADVSITKDNAIVIEIIQDSIGIARGWKFWRKN